MRQRPNWFEQVVGRQLISMMDDTSGSEKGPFFGQLHELAWTCTAS